MSLVKLVVFSVGFDVTSRLIGRRHSLALYLIATAVCVAIAAAWDEWDYATYGHGRCFKGDVRVRCDSDPVFKRNYHNIWFCLGDRYDPPDCEPDILPSSLYGNGVVTLHRQVDEPEKDVNYGVYVSMPSGQTTNYGVRPKWEFPAGALCAYPRCNATSYLDYCP